MRMEAFVVRIWSPAEDEGADGGSSVLQGVVEHVRSARSRPFRDEEQLLGVLRSGRRSFSQTSWTRTPTDPRGEPGAADLAIAVTGGTDRAARIEGGRS